MKIAILHHHYNPGGVTRVVQNHVQALVEQADFNEPLEILVLHGGRSAGWKPIEPNGSSNVSVQLDTVAGLDYDSRAELHCDQLTDTISETLARHGFGTETILHVHNHSLGKNVSLPGALRQLAERGYRQVLQIHDFAEDLRPRNYGMYRAALETDSAAVVSRYVYPAAKQIHYVTLNTRDHDVLLATGAERDRVHLLPNPVASSEELPPKDSARRKVCDALGIEATDRLIVYPVRGIRRKNVGELLLWSALSEPGTTFAITLPATSDAERPRFERWKEFASSLELPVLFDIGLDDRLSFNEIMSAADAILTTSVAEGFGLVFLESWLHRRPLIGRNLPEITRDFSGRGLDLEHLVARVNVPLQSIDCESYAQTILSMQAQLCRDYGQTMAADTERSIQEIVASGQVDFGGLPTAMQESVIERAVRDRDTRSALLERNPSIAAALQGDGLSQDRIDANAEVVREQFSLAANGKQLMQIYRDVASAPVGGEVSELPQGENILTKFLDVRRLHPVRIEA